MFLIYVLFLIVSGIAMLVMASVKGGQAAGRRVWYAVFGAGFTLYGLYLLLFFRGGHYLVFFYVFILPVLVTVRFFRDRSAFRARQQAAALQGPPPGYAQPSGYALPSGRGAIQDAAATAAETAGLAPGGAHTPTGPGDAGSGPQMTVGNIGAPPWAPGTPLPHELVGQRTEPGHPRKGVLVIAGAGFVVLAATVVVIVIAASSSTSSTSSKVARPATSSSSSTSQGQMLTFYDLQPGDCLQGSNLSLGTSREWPEYITDVPCTQHHIAEVFYAKNVWPKSLAFPGDKAVTRKVDRRCNSAFVAYDGATDSVSAFTYEVIAPYYRSDWSRGDRFVVCVAYESTSQQPGGASVDFSIRGSKF